MPPSGGGGQVRHHGSRAASSEAELHARGRVPRARWELAQGGAKSSSEVGFLWRGAWPSSETKVCPRGAEAGYLMGRRGFSGHRPFFALGRGHAGCD
jgi:hypothetical protein